MALTLFKKTSTTPAHDALKQHLSVTADIHRQFAAIAARMQLAAKDIEHAETMAIDIQVRRDAINVALSNAKYSDAPAPVLKAERRALEDLENKFKAVSEAARVARLMQPKLQADLDSLNARLRALHPETNHLLWQALLEEVASLQPEYEAAVEQMRAVMHWVFAACQAADDLASANGFGTFMGYHLFHELRIPRPAHEAYADGLNPGQILAAHHADMRLLEQEAQDLASRMLTHGC